ncbi:hypothetical protein ACJX0J_025270, partial [Zea mays]
MTPYFSYLCIEDIPILLFEKNTELRREDLAQEDLGDEEEAKEGKSEALYEAWLCNNMKLAYLGGNDKMPQTQKGKIVVYKSFFQGRFWFRIQHMLLVVLKNVSTKFMSYIMRQRYELDDEEKCIVLLQAK